MSKGNIIIAKNVGQTNLLVKDLENGFLCEEGKPESLAHCLHYAMNLSNKDYELMALKSIGLMRSEQTLQKFIEQFDQFVTH